MIINSVTEIYFSPTNTTQKVINAISKGMELKEKETINITLPCIREKNISSIKGDIVIIGVPVYAERVPKMAADFLERLKVDKKPAVIVGVYGNMGDGIVLDELYKFASDAGFKVMAAATFVAEHSFSTDKTQVAKGHPDKKDLEMAENFGHNIIEKMKKIDDINDISLMMPKGKLQLMAKILPESVSKLVTKKPEVNRDLCTNCNACAKFCPVGAIDITTLEIDEDKCIRCFSCVRKCPKRARRIIYKHDFIVSKVLKMKSRQIKEPKIYI